MIEIRVDELQGTSGSLQPWLELQLYGPGTLRISRVGGSSNYQNGSQANH